MSWVVHTGDNLDALRQMPDCSVDAVVTDPPYGLGTPPDAMTMLRAWLDDGAMPVKGRGFMGKEWDAFVPQPSTWREVYRVLKPGGHLLAFAGTRTQDLMALSLRIAGFEIRDMLGWLYGSGFPKSLDVSKAIDKQRYDLADVYRVTAWVRERRDAAGIGNKDIDNAFGFAGMAGHWTSAKSQPAVPTLEQVPTLLDVLGVALDDVPDDIRHLLWELNGRKGHPGENWAKREVTGQHEHAAAAQAWRANYGFDADLTGKERRDIPATDAARQWNGWGTALKPAIEPITLARKPLDGTVAANVLKWGTGGLNVDGCKIGTEGGGTNCTNRDEQGNCRGHKNAGQSTSGGWETFHGPNTSGGRWPANILHDGSDEVEAVFPDDASRFFYSAKTATWEREIGLRDVQKRTAAELVDRDVDSAGMANQAAGAGGTSAGRANSHPTVKGVDVMRWLVRLVTPPGGTVLDPYTGSGTTGMACILEGFAFIGCELSAEYADIARARIAATEARQGVKVTDGKLTADDTPAAQMRLL